MSGCVLWLCACVVACGVGCGAPPVVLRVVALIVALLRVVSCWVSRRVLWCKMCYSGVCDCAVLCVARVDFMVQFVLCSVLC